MLAKSKTLILAQEEKIRASFKEFNVEKTICFFEFWGPNSFAGQHQENEQHTVALIDVCVFKKGFLEPFVFLEIFDLNPNINTPKFLHYGPIDKDFETKVRESKLEGMSYEGVVCKTYNKHKYKMEMYKIKSNKWISDIKMVYKNNPKVLEQSL